MIEEEATVIETDGRTMSVEIRRQSSCGNCSAKSGCGTSLVASLFGKQRSMLSLPNTINADAGDRVVLGIDEKDLVRGSLRLYLWPLAGLLGGAVAGHLVSGMELISILGGLMGITAVLLMQKRRQITPPVEVLRREPVISIEPANFIKR